MERSRIIEINVRLLLNEGKMLVDTFAEKMGYSIFDAQKLLDGRLFVSQEDLEDMSQIFNVPVAELTVLREREAYSGPGFMHYMKCFNNPENEEKIRDLFDMYCDLKEAVIE